MKKTVLTLLLCLAQLIPLWSCEDSNNEKSETQNGQKKSFVLYDAMNYLNKPIDLSDYGLSRMMIIYEAHLTKQDPNDEYGKILDMEKIANHANTAYYSGIKFINTDIEHWYGDKNINSEEMGKRFTAMFDAFRAKIKDVEIGNYGVAPSALCVYRFYDGGKTDEATLLKKWKENNKKRWDVAKTVDYFSPSVYIAEPNIESWIKDLEITAKEVRAFDPTKKFIVYIWPNYYDKPGSPYFKQFVDPKIWEQMLEAVYKHCDGAVIWNSTLDVDGKKLDWNDSRVQTFMNITKRFTNKYDIKPASLKITSASTSTVNTSRTKQFEMFASIKYPGTPNLEKHGLKSIRMASEAGLSGGKKDENNIFILDSVKVVQLARHAQKHLPGTPICIQTGSWINDRTKNNKAMLERFETASRIFKNNNGDANKLSFFNVGPTSLTMLRNSTPDNIRRVESWYRYSWQPTKDLTQFADIILPSVVLVDDNIEEWEADFKIMIEEAKAAASGKPIYAYIWTQYFNKEAKPIASKTWFRILEVVYSLCDGAIIASNSQSESQKMQWDDKFDFWRATEAFMKEYKIVAID